MTTVESPFFRPSFALYWVLWMKFLPKSLRGIFLQSSAWLPRYTAFSLERSVVEALTEIKRALLLFNRIQKLDPFMGEQIRETEGQQGHIGPDEINWPIISEGDQFYNIFKVGSQRFAPFEKSVRGRGVPQGATKYGLNEPVYFWGDHKPLTSEYQNNKLGASEPRKNKKK